MKPSKSKQPTLGKRHRKLPTKSRRIRKYIQLGKIWWDHVLLTCAKLVFRDSTYLKTKQILISNGTNLSCIYDLAESMKRRLISKINKSPFFTIQMDELTDVASVSQQLVFVMYIHGQKIEEDFLFSQPPPKTSAKAGEVMQLYSLLLLIFWGEWNLTWIGVVWFECAQMENLQCCVEDPD